MAFDENEYVDLTRPHFLRGSLAAAERHVIEQEFSSYVTDVVRMIDDGKEATVYLCRARPEAAGTDHAAAKMYRARKFRAFANDASYVNTAKMRDRRLAKAMRKRSRHGRHAAQHLWIDREWHTLELLHGAGASVPRPIARCAGGILMEFLGANGERAPRLAEVRLSREDAEHALAAIRRDLEILLACGVVHGDLSPYNVLYFEGRPRLIDLPQAMRIDDAPDAWSLFYRDVANVTDYFGRQGVAVDAIDFAKSLWT